MRHERWKDFDRIGTDDEFVMICVVEPGDFTRVTRLIKFLNIEADRKRLYSSGRLLGHCCDDGA